MQLQTLFVQSLTPTLGVACEAFSYCEITKRSAVVELKGRIFKLKVFPYPKFTTNFSVQ